MADVERLRRAAAGDEELPRVRVDAQAVRTVLAARRASTSRPSCATRGRSRASRPCPRGSCRSGRACASTAKPSGSPVECRASPSPRASSASRMRIDLSRGVVTQTSLRLRDVRDAVRHRVERVARASSRACARRTRTSTSRRDFRRNARRRRASPSSARRPACARPSPPRRSESPGSARIARVEASITSTRPVFPAGTQTERVARVERDVVHRDPLGGRTRQGLHADGVLLVGRRSRRGGQRGEAREDRDEAGAARVHRRSFRWSNSDRRRC